MPNEDDIIDAVALGYPIYQNRVPLDGVEYRVDWDALPIPAVVNDGTIPDTTPIPVVAYRNGVRIGDNAMPTTATEQPWPEVAVTPTVTPSATPATYYYHGVKRLRLAINEYVRPNVDTSRIGWDSSYSACEMGSPRLDWSSRRITAMDDNWPDYNFFLLDNSNRYLDTHLSYGFLIHCCGRHALTYIPKEKLRFLKALWMIVGGKKASITLAVDAVDAPAPTHYHDITFTSDWSHVKLHIHPLRGGPIPTTLAGLKDIEKTYGKHKDKIGMPTGAALEAFKINEKEMIGDRTKQLEAVYVKAKSAYDYALDEDNEYKKYVSESECLVGSFREAVSSMSMAGKDFMPLMHELNRAISNNMQNKRGAISTARKARETAAHLETTKHAFDNSLNPRSCTGILERLHGNKIIKGYQFNNGGIDILFSAYDMPIAPTEKCRYDNTLCRCAIVIPGTIKIPDFILRVYKDGSNLYFKMIKHKQKFLAPHFKSDGNYCLGGYEEAVWATLKLYDISGFIMVMTDYFHSFDVHSMLSNDSDLDFECDSAKYPSRDGIFTEEPEDYENGGNEDDDECGNCGARDGCDCD